MPADEVPNLRGGHGTTIMFIVALVAPILSVSAIIWKAARYPDREEMQPVINDVIHLKMDFAVYKAEQKADSDRVNMKLDQLLQDNRKGQGRAR